MWSWFRRETDYERLQRAYEARLGRMTLAWNQMESAVDGLVETLFWLFDMSSVKVTARPMSLDQKLSAVRRAYNGIEALAPHKDGSLAVMNQISDIMEMRHKLTHGVLVKCLANGDVMLMSLRFKPDGPTLDMPVIRAQKINELTNKSVKLFPRIAALVEAIAPSIDEMKRLWPQVAEEAAQRFDGAVRRLPASERRGVRLRSGTSRAPRR